VGIIDTGARFSSMTVLSSLPSIATAAVERAIGAAAVARLYVGGDGVHTERFRSAYGLRMVRTLLLPLLGLSFAAAATVRAEEPLVVEETFLAVTIKGKPYRLEALIMKEAGANRRLPIALITHGQVKEAEKREAVEPRHFLQVARDFARRGWLAAGVIRRGFGRSQGTAPYVLRGCRDGDVVTPMDDQTDDLEAALKVIGQRPDADASTVVAFGVSVGGAAVLNLAARQPEALRAVINMSGGIRFMPRPNGEPAACTAEELIPFFASLGKRSRLPTLWLYAENDTLFPGNYVRQLHEAYVAAGGRADFHMFDPIGEDGHFMMGHVDGLLRWLPALDRFLRTNGLHTYDPAPIAAAVSGLNPTAELRAVVRRYEGRATEKALVVSQSNKAMYVQFAGTDLAKTEAKALEICVEKTKEPCRPFLRNFELVTPGQ
jgi:dienelactone hydrolase